MTTSSMFRQTVVLPHECSCVRVCVGFAVGGVATPGAGVATTQLKLQPLSPVSPVPATVARSVSRSPRPAQSGASCPVTQLSQQNICRLNLVKNINFGLDQIIFFLTHRKIVFWVTEHFCIKWTFLKNAFFCPKKAFF